MIAAVVDFADARRARVRAQRMADATSESVAWRETAEGGPIQLVSDAASDGASISTTAQGLRLARSHMGGAPIYFARVEGGVVASGRVAAVVAALGRPAIDAGRLAASALAMFDDEPATVHQHVERLRAGEIVELDANGARRTRPVPELDALDGTVEDIARELARRIDAAVARAIRGCDRVAVLAGGGVDSSCVLAAAVAQARGASHREVQAIALDFAGPGDDRPYMDALASELGIVPLRVQPRSCARYMRPGLVLDALPLTWPTVAWELTMVEMAKAHGAAVVLTGTGGDDLLDGDPTILGRDAARGRLLSAVRAAARLREPWASSPARRIRDYVVRPVAKRLAPRSLRAVWRARRARLALPTWAGPAARCLADVAGGPVADGHTPAERFARFSFSAGVLAISDMRGQVEAATAVRRADPLLDASIADLVARVSPRFLLHGDRVRGLLRLAFAGRVPDAVRLREDKAAFEPAIHEMIHAAGGLEAFADLTSMTALADLGIVEPKAFRAAVKRFASGEDDDWLALWPAVACEAFARSGYLAGAHA